MSSSDEDEALVIAQDECGHDWRRTGYHPEFGTLYECSKCGGVTP